MATLKELELHFNRITALEEPERNTYLKELAAKNETLAERLSRLLTYGDDIEQKFESPLIPKKRHPLRHIWRVIEAEKDRPPLRIGPYRIGRILGEGGMGIVYKGIREDIVQEVALKVLRSKHHQTLFGEHFRVESQALALMKHENIAHFYNAGQTEADEPYLAMEYIDGVQIFQYCENQSLDLKARIELMIQVCDGVLYAHSLGVIHGDLKPANMLVVTRLEGPKVKIIDFGIAQGISKATASLLQKPSGLLFGSPRYMSPEQAEPDRILDIRCDIFALGAILFELISGQPSIEFSENDDNVAILKLLKSKHRRELLKATTPERMARIGLSWKKVHTHLKSDLQWISKKALALDLEKRYTTVKELRDDLSRFLNDYPVLAAPANGWYRYRKWWRRHKILAFGTMAATVGLVVAFIGILVALRRSEELRQALEKVSQTHNFYNKIVQAPHPFYMGSNIRFQDVLAFWESQIGQQESINDPEQAAHLHITFANTCFGLGLYRRAQQHYSVAYKLLLHARGPQDFDTLLAEDRLAYVGMKLNKLPEAKAQFQDLLTKNKGKPALHLSALRGLMSVRLLENNLQQAGILASKLENELAAFKGEMRDIHASRAVLAEYFEKKGRYALVDQLRTKISEEQKNYLGESHPRTLETINNLANTKWRRGLFPEALDLYEKVATEREKTLGKLHPYTMKSYHGRALALWQLGKLKEAREIAERIFKQSDVVHGPNHLQTLDVLNTLGALESDLGQIDQAVSTFEDLVARLKKVKNLVSDTGLWATNNLANNLMKIGDLERAGSLSDDAVRIGLRLYDPWHKEALDPRVTRAEIFEAAGDQEKALATLREVFQMAKDHYIGDPQIIARYGIYFGQMLVRAGKFPTAEIVFKTCFEQLEGKSGTKDALAKNLIALFEKTGMASEALPYENYLSSQDESKSQVIPQ